MSNRILIGGSTFQEPFDLSAGAQDIAGAQAHQRALFEQFDALQIDAGFVVRTRGALVKIDGPRKIAPFTIQIPVGFKGFAELADHVEELTTLEREIEILLALVHLTTIKMAARDVQVRRRFLR